MIPSSDWELGVIPSSDWVFSHRKFPQTQRTELHSTVDQQTLYIIFLTWFWFKSILIQFGVGLFDILTVKQHKWACLKVSVILCFLTNYQYFGPHRWKRGKYLRRSPRGYHSWPARYEVACLAFRRPNIKPVSIFLWKILQNPSATLVWACVE